MSDPYFAFRFLPKEGWYCHYCRIWHYPSDDGIHAWNVCATVHERLGDQRGYETSMPQFISCNEENCREIVVQFNEGHYKMASMSKNPDKPVLL